jgi:hypothetical protein
MIAPRVAACWFDSTRVQAFESERPGDMAKIKPEFDTQGYAPNCPIVGDSDVSVSKLYGMRCPRMPPPWSTIR